jgi:CysZ protein
MQQAYRQRAGTDSRVPAKVRSGAMARVDHMPAGSRVGVLGGAGYLPRGIGMFLRTPGVRLLGLLPALLAALLVLVLLGLLASMVDEAARALTPFADHWAEGARTALRLGVGFALLVAFLLLAVVTFVTLTNLIGQPFFERLSDQVERRLGHPPAGVDAPWWRTLPRATVESVLLLALVVAVNAPLFVLDLLPGLGQTVVPALQALASGFLLSVELLAIPLQRRGLHLGERLRFAWRHRGAVTGFGVAAFLLFLVPLANVLAMPGSIVGGTLLVRRLTGTPGD